MDVFFWTLKLLRYIYIFEFLHYTEKRPTGWTLMFFQLIGIDPYSSFTENSMWSKASDIFSSNLLEFKLDSVFPVGMGLLGPPGSVSCFHMKQKTYCAPPGDAGLSDQASFFSSPTLWNQAGPSWGRISWFLSFLVSEFPNLSSLKHHNMSQISKEGDVWDSRNFPHCVWRKRSRNSWSI